MPFGASASLVSTDMDNILRGISPNSGNSSVTGTVAETNLSITTILANKVGTTGGLHILAQGTITGAAGTKTMRLKFGGTTIATIGPTLAGTTTDWFFDVWCFNTATNAQRWFVLKVGTDLLQSTFDYTTSAIDTTSDQFLLVTGQLSNAADTITQTGFNVFVVQIQ